MAGVHEATVTKFEEPQPLRRSWMNNAVWPFFAAIGWLLFEITSEPGVGLFATCMHCGWNDLLNAFWVLRVDPNRSRSHALFWVCLARSVLMIMGSSILVTCLAICGVTFVSSGAQAPQEPKKARLADVWHIVLIYPYTIPIFSILMLIGCLFALRSGQRLWLNSGLGTARRRNEWPPICTTDPRSNHADLMMSIMTLGLTGLAFMAGYMLWAKYDVILPGAILFVATFSGSYLLCRKVLAAAPEQCWGVTPPDTEVNPADDFPA